MDFGSAELVARQRRSAGPVYLFVYGTLQPAADTAMGRWVAERSEWVAPASAPGRIVAIASAKGWYPAMLSGRADERCSGTLVRVSPAPGERALLDRYEGREFRRGVLRVRTQEGGVYAAGVYLWRGNPPAGAVAVRGGDFLVWLRQTRRSPFDALRNRG